MNITKLIDARNKAEMLLRRDKITLTEYHTIEYLVEEIAMRGKAETVLKNVADTFKKWKFKVSELEFGRVGYKITL